MNDSTGKAKLMEHKIAGYTIIDADSDEELCEKVNNFIRSDYQPLGGPVVFTRMDGTQTLLQAMVSASPPAHR